MKTNEIPMDSGDFMDKISKLASSLKKNIQDACSLEEENARTIIRPRRGRACIGSARANKITLKKMRDSQLTWISGELLREATILEDAVNSFA